MVAMGKPPQIHRKKGEFYFEWLKTLDRETWRATQDRVRAEKLDAPPAPVLASDCNGAFVAMAQKSALKARVEKYMTFATSRFQDLAAPAEPGLVVTNLPYGERIGAKGRGAAPREDFEGEGTPASFFAELASHWKRNYAGWTAWVLSPEMKLPSLMRLKESQRVPMWNGPIECRLFRFDMVAGSARR